MPTPTSEPRQPGEPFVCPKCGARYPHDGGYKHESFDCPERKGVAHGRK